MSNMLAYAIHTYTYTYPKNTEMDLKSVKDIQLHHEKKMLTKTVLKHHFSLIRKPFLHQD